MHLKTSQAAEDYLKAIYEMTRGGLRAGTNQIAERMGVTPASATGMVQKLANEQPPLLDYEKHRGAALTPTGEQIALEIIRHHRLLETFLQEKLGYTWDEVHSEADRLEHVISEELEERIARLLGDPVYDPHGEPIPSREFEMPASSPLRLNDLPAGSQAEVERIHSTDPALLRYLASIDLLPGAQVQVLSISPFDDNVALHIGKNPEPVVLGSRVTKRIFVRPPGFGE